jgi:hypothetical protein
MSAVSPLQAWNIIRRLNGLAEIKEAFVDAASMGSPPIGGMPMGSPIPMDPSMMGGAPPMDPAMMGGAPPMDPSMMGGAPPMDPSMMGGAPPMDPSMMGGAPPVDPSMQAMGDQEAIRSVIREEIQKALGSGTDAGQGVSAGGTKKGGNKFDDAIAQLRQEMQQQTKTFAVALRQAGIEIPLADLLSMDGSLGTSAGNQGSPQKPEPGISETLQPGTSGATENGGVGKIASIETEVEMLTKLANAKDALKRSALAEKITKFDPRAVDLSYLNGLYC